MRAARGGFRSKRDSKISRWVVSSQGVTNDGCQNHAECCTVFSRTRFFTAATCPLKSLESAAGGAANRNWLPEESTHGRQVPASGVVGFVLLHFPGVGGKEPVKA